MKKNKMGSVILILFLVLFCTQGGNRTRTPKNWILNPARLPIPPPGHTN